MTWRISRFRASFLLAVIPLGMVALWKIFGTSWVDIAKFMGYELLGIILPGVLLYGLIWNREKSWFKLLAVGWAAGYALEVALFDLTGGLGLRAVFHFYPLVNLPLLAIWIWRRKGEHTKIELPGANTNTRHLVLLVGFVLAAITLMAFVYFPETPLPGAAPSVNYYSDLVFHISSAAEAKNHFPIGDPHILGEPIYYYWFVNSHLGAVSFVTGIEISVLVFRLYILALVCLISAQLYLLGRGAGKSHVVGLMAIGLVFLSGEIDLTPQTTDLWPIHEGYTSFLNLFYVFLRLAPSLIMGCALFLATITTASDFIETQPRRLPQMAFQIVFIGMMSLSVINAKLFPSAVLIGGLILFALWSLWANKKIETGAVAIALLANGLLLYRFFTYFRFNQGAPIFVNPLMMAQFMPALSGLAAEIKTWPGALQPIALILLNAVGFTGQMPFHVIGSLLLLVMTRGRPTRQMAFLLSFFIAGTGFLWVFWFNGAYALLHTAYLCGAVTGAAGIWMFLNAIKAWPGWKKTFVYAPLLVLLALVLMDIPLDNLAKWRNMLMGRATYSTKNNLLTSKLYAGMMWLRNNSSPGDMIAVNNQYREGNADPRYIYFSAFAERRVFIEGWIYEHDPWQDARMPGFPYLEQLTLNQKTFVNADVDAARSLANRGVKFLVVDKLHGKWDGDIAAFSTKVFENSDVEIYLLSTAKLAQGAP